MANRSSTSTFPHAIHRSSRWLRRVNLLAIALTTALLLSFLIVSTLVGKPPYDYWLLMNGADLFCFHNTAFQYGLNLHIYYPAPFYSTFCLPYHDIPTILLWFWMLTPFVLALWLGRGRAAVFAYPPLGILFLIGQSSWLMLPLFMLAARLTDGRRVPWWSGIILGLSVLKPQVALVAALWLVYQWRNQWRVLLAGALTVVLVSLPAFVLRPGWLGEWLPNGRGFEPINLASIAFVPVQLGRMDFAPGAGAQLAVWGFCALVGVGGYELLRWRRGRLTFYDWVLLFVLVSPVLNDYDLVVLLPFVANRPKRLLVALTAGLVSWLFAMMTLRWSMSFMVTLMLVVLRLWHDEDSSQGRRGAGAQRAFVKS